MAESIRLGDLANRVKGRVHGDPERLIRNVAPLDTAGPTELSFLANARYLEAAEKTCAGAVLVGPRTALPGHDLLEVPEPHLALAEILEIFHPPRECRPGIHPDAHLGQGVAVGAVEIGPYAVIGDEVHLSDGCVIGAGCVVGDGSMVGESTVLMPRVVLYPGTRVGRRCRIHAGVVLGGDGFGFTTSDGRHRKVPQIGKVIVEDDVEIGANTTIDRGALGDTVIGEGTKIDNLVMVAHGVRVGPGGLLAGQTGIAGSTRLGARVTIAGQSGAAGHLEIGEDSVIAAKSAVFQDLPSGSFVSGIPATDHKAWKRAQAVVKKLPELRTEIRALEERLRALEGKLKREG